MWLTIEYIGATETTGSMTGVDWDLNDETCSVGLPFPNMKIRLVDAKLNDVEPGQPGEMLVSGPVVCQGACFMLFYRAYDSISL